MRWRPKNGAEWRDAAFLTITILVPVILGATFSIVLYLGSDWALGPPLDGLRSGPLFLGALCTCAPLTVVWFGIGLSYKGAKRRRFVDLLFLAALIVMVAAVILPAFARAREKPVIYLYPEVEQRVSVRLDYDGELLHTYPAYGPEGWDVLAQPNGDLVDIGTGRTHYCLFWEGVDDYQHEIDTGFVVLGADTAAFLENALAQLGLTDREANEFIIYWLPRMERNAYNLIHFETDAYNERVPLNVTPPPDTMIRVLMVFKGLRRPVVIEPQTLEAPERCGFTVVEWGGTELR